MDETAAARGQDYVRVFMDADAHRVLQVTALAALDDRLWAHVP